MHVFVPYWHLGFYGDLLCRGQPPRHGFRATWMLDCSSWFVEWLRFVHHQELQAGRRASSCGSGFSRNRSERPPSISETIALISTLSWTTFEVLTRLSPCNRHIKHHLGFCGLASHTCYQTKEDGCCLRCLSSTQSTLQWLSTRLAVTYFRTR